MYVGHNVFRFDYAGGLRVVGHAGNVLGFTGCLYWVDGGDAVVTVVCNVGSMHSGGVPGVAYIVGMRREFIEAAMRVAAQK